PRDRCAGNRRSVRRRSCSLSAGTIKGDVRGNQATNKSQTIQSGMPPGVGGWMLTEAEIAKLERFLAGALDGKLRIASLTRVHGGASRETYAFDAVFAQNGAAQTRPFILRRDPPGTLAVSTLPLEYAAYNSVLGHGVPIPRPLALVTDQSVLGAQCLIME